MNPDWTAYTGTVWPRSTILESQVILSSDDQVDDRCFARGEKQAKGQFVDDLPGELML